MKKAFFVLISLHILILSTAYIQAEILIGVAAPITGSNATFGEQIQKGVSEAVSIINAEGGIRGEKIRIIIGDDMSDPRQGISVANKFVTDKVKFVVGHFSSSVSLPASGVYAENGIIQISPAATTPSFTERGLWNVFRTCGRDDAQGKIAGDYISKHFRDHKIAILHDKTPYGQGLADETRKSLNANGIYEVMYNGINAGEKDFAALVSKMKYKGVSVLYWGGFHTEAGLLIRQIAEQKLNVRFVSGDAILSNELTAITGDSVIGTLNTFGVDPTLNPENHALIAKFKASGFNPEAYTLYSYAAIQVIAQAIKIAETTDTKIVAQTMKQKGPFKTVLGEINFNEKGDPDLPPYMMYEWRKKNDGGYIYEPRLD